ncbi:MAG: TerC family protein [Gammaproteobacteria bacterium]|nr:TerC family protein [Gammaproteobacteria bacterium]
MEMFWDIEFWVRLSQVILIDLLLGGDNAVVIALATRQLPKHQRTQGILWGTAGALLIRVVMAYFALSLLQVPFLRMVGGLLLFWIGVKMVASREEEELSKIKSSEKMFDAIKTIVIADMVMGIDNVVGIAAVASQNEQYATFLIVSGLMVSVPIIILSSQLFLKLIDKYPIIVILGSCLLGWIGGSIFIGDKILEGFQAWAWVGVEPMVTPINRLLNTSITSNQALGWLAGIAGVFIVYTLGRCKTPAKI